MSHLTTINQAIYKIDFYFYLLATMVNIKLLL